MAVLGTEVHGEVVVNFSGSSPLDLGDLNDFRSLVITHGGNDSSIVRASGSGDSGSLSVEVPASLNE